MRHPPAVVLHGYLTALAHSARSFALAPVDTLAYPRCGASKMIMAVASHILAPAGSSINQNQCPDKRSGATDKTERIVPGIDVGIAASHSRNFLSFQSEKNIDP